MIACGWLIGNSLSSIYRERQNLLERFNTFLLFCESEITYEKEELSTIIDKFLQEKNKFDSYIFNRNYIGIYMEKPTRTFINTFLDKISILDSETQKKYFAEAKNQISIMETNALKKVNTQGKMMKKLIPVIAIGLFILTL